MTMPEIIAKALVKDDVFGIEYLLLESKDILSRVKDTI